MQENEPGSGKPLPDKSEIPEDEIIGLPEEWIVGRDSPNEILLEKPEDPPMLPRPKILSAVKGVMKGAHLPKPDFPKPVKRPVILPDPAPAEQSVLADIRNPAPPFIIEEPSVIPEATCTLKEIPPFCKNCGKKVPPVANFCPACGIPLASLQTGPAHTHPERKTMPEGPPFGRKKGTLRK
jgi:hypothetical protein